MNPTDAATGPAWFGTSGDLAVDLATLTAATARIGGLVVGDVIHHTDKSLVTTGTYQGVAVIIKLLTAAPRDGGPDWFNRHLHEHRVLAAATADPPPATVPELVLMGTSPLTITSRLPGARVGEHRYTDSVDEQTAAAICDALTGFAAWEAPPEVRRPWWNYPTRVERARADGLLSASDHRATTRLLDIVGDRRVLQHGDVLPTNLLHDPHTGRVALVDLEFVGTYVEGLDLALVDLLIGSRSPALRATVTARVASDGLEVGYALNLLLLVAREIALHRHLPDPTVRTTRQNLLARELDRAQALVAETARRHP
jgi:hypothetical protein